MNNSLSFFRVFDLAFFAPGMLLFGAMWYSGCFFDFSIYEPSSSNATVHEILTGAFAIAFIYLLGLICHGIQRVIFNFIEKKISNPHSDSWYLKMTHDHPRNELALYFWYMRSTCWNLAVAIVVSVILILYQDKLTFSLAIGLWFILVIGVLIYLGYEFNKGMKKAAN